MRARRGLPAGLAALGVALTSACTAVYQGGGPPTVMVSSPFGPPRVVAGGASAAPPGGRLAMPPANLEPPQPSAPTAVDRSGVYGGTAAVLDTGGGVCLQNHAVRGFRVTGSQVRWGRFRGTIAPDDGLQMVSGTTWVYGQFVGDTFHGQISFWGAFNNPGCTYVMELRKTGA